jgi:hypothetical protein
MKSGTFLATYFHGDTKVYTLSSNFANCGLYHKNVTSVNDAYTVDMSNATI